MNPVERRVRRLDAWQQRHPAPAFLFAVVKKFGDDQGGNLVALLTYYAFLATFPLLLALTGILGILLRGDPSLQHRVVNSALSEFPIVGQQLHSQLGLSSLHRSGPAVVIGILGAAFGGRGLANAAQNAMNTVWHVPRVDRPGFPHNLLRTFGLLGLLAVAAVLTAAEASIFGSGHVLGLHGVPFKVLAFAVSALVDIGVFTVGMRLAVAPAIRTRDLIPGAAMSGIAWQILLSLAGIIVSHDLRHAQAIAGLFGVVLGLLAWFGLQATVTIYAVEADVVRARRLWPRAIVNPPLTPADKQSLSGVVAAEVRRPEQQVSIRYGTDPGGTNVHDVDPETRAEAAQRRPTPAHRRTRGESASRSASPAEAEIATTRQATDS